MLLISTQQKWKPFKNRKRSSGVITVWQKHFWLTWAGTRPLPYLLQVWCWSLWLWLTSQSSDCFTENKTFVKNFQFGESVFTIIGSSRINSLLLSQVGPINEELHRKLGKCTIFGTFPNKHRCICRKLGERLIQSPDWIPAGISPRQIETEVCSGTSETLFLQLSSKINVTWIVSDVCLQSDWKQTWKSAVWKVLGDYLGIGPVSGFPHHSSHVDVLQRHNRHIFNKKCWFKEKALKSQVLQIRVQLWMMASTVPSILNYKHSNPEGQVKATFSRPLLSLCGGPCATEWCSGFPQTAA